MTGAWSIGAHPEDCLSIIDACKMRGVKYQYLDQNECCEAETSAETAEDAASEQASADSAGERIIKNKINEIEEKSDFLIAKIG